uniref:Uncharacterized protein n=1 Tax=Rhizophora mucronata TaxID=61149 RepID=A0A2P2NDB0_RHIMU
MSSYWATLSKHMLVGENELTLITCGRLIIPSPVSFS